MKEKAIHEAKMAKSAAAIRAAKARAREFEEAAQEAVLKRNRIRAARIELTRLKDIEQNKAAAAQRAAEEAAQLWPMIYLFQSQLLFQDLLRL